MPKYEPIVKKNLATFAEYALELLIHARPSDCGYERKAGKATAGPSAST
jgi:hypothetical protein